MSQRLQALYGLKWNPFSPELPLEALYVPVTSRAKRGSASRDIRGATTIFVAGFGRGSSLLWSVRRSVATC
jgi:hypothetical protein